VSTPAATTVELASTLVAALPRNFGPYATLMLSGFVIGTLGHLTRQRWLVAIGVILIALGVLLLPLALNASTRDEPPPPPRVVGLVAG
jgi:sulfite exporter TauE/SafE